MPPKRKSPGTDPSGAAETKKKPRTKKGNPTKEGPKTKTLAAKLNAGLESAKATTKALNDAKSAETKKRPKTKKDRQEAPKKYPVFGVEATTMTVDGAKEMVGWRPAKEGEKGIPYKGEKWVPSLNARNRPLSLSRAKEQAIQMLEGVWAGQTNSDATTGDGSTHVADWNGYVTNGGHRLVAQILADAVQEHVRQTGGEEALEEMGYIQGAIEFPAVVVTGIDPAAADKTDKGLKRTLGQIFYRHGEFSGEKYSDAERKKLCNQLYHAVKLLWGRINGYGVAGCPVMRDDVALNFLDAHPLLRKAVEDLYTIDGKSGKLIHDYMPLGQAAALSVLMAASYMDREKYEVDYEMKVKDSLWQKVIDFWTLFAQFSARDISMKESPIVGALQVVLSKDKESMEKMSRDAKHTVVARAWKAWTKEKKGKWGNARALTSAMYTRSEGKQVLNMERFGGLDLDMETLVVNGWVRKEPVFGQRKTGEWKVGDTCWVWESNGEHWFGGINQISDNGKNAVILAKDDKVEYVVLVENLCVDEPGTEEE